MDSRRLAELDLRAAAARSQHLNDENEGTILALTGIGYALLAIAEAVDELKERLPDENERAAQQRGR
jgi:2-hydroxychromene-2-carboxylate isomerase